MNPTSLVPDPEQEFRLYYLIPIAYVYLFTVTNNGLYFWCSLVGVFGAAARHSSEEAIWGPGFTERRELSEEAQVKRSGTLIYQDKPPHEYSAESYDEMMEEGEFQSKSHLITIALLLGLQGALALLYVFSLYAFYTNQGQIDFVGGIIIFALLAYSGYAILSALLPDASDLHYEKKLDPEFNSALEGVVQNLYVEGIRVKGGEYEPAEAGAVTLDLNVDYEFSPEIRRDINRVAFSLCALVSRSSYPISIIELSMETTDDGSANFVVKGDWCRKMEHGDLSSQEFSRKVQESVITEPPTDNRDD